MLARILPSGSSSSVRRRRTVSTRTPHVVWSSVHSFAHSRATFVHPSIVAVDDPPPSMPVMTFPSSQRQTEQSIAYYLFIYFYFFQFFKLRRSSVESFCFFSFLDETCFARPSPPESLPGPHLWSNAVDGGHGRHEVYPAVVLRRVRYTCRGRHCIRTNCQISRQKKIQKKRCLCVFFNG